jgi:ribosomal-protein-alanine N-acetyltransferase
MFPILETERLLLREIVKEDAQGIFNCFSNNDVTRYYGQDTLTSIEQAKQFVEFFAKNYNEKRGIRWGIEIKGYQGIIGTIGFNAWFTKHKRAEIGYELHPEYWQKGYATEAVSEVISYGLKELDLTRIGAIVFIENIASNELLTKLGFEKEGVLRNYMYQNGVPYDTNVYSLLKSI